MRFILCFAFATIANALVAEPQQMPDPNFDTRVTQPVLSRERPRLLFDEAHYNVHRADTTYRAFADLVRSDGARLDVNRSKFTRRSLSRYQILVIAGPLGGPIEDQQRATAPAFGPTEIEAVTQWVHRGGGLFLLTDHEPVASASAGLVAAFGVSPSKTVILDREHRLENMYPANILATVENGLLRQSPITCGVQRVLVFGGQTLESPAGSIVIGVGSAARLEDGGKPTGNSQVSAFRFGRGHVIVTGDMGMLSAQLMVDDDVKTPWGMNWPEIDNRQLLLNSVRWLAGLQPCGKSRR
jgi:hypothetical protein